MIEHINDTLSVKRKCELLSIARSSIYYQTRSVVNDDTTILNEIRDIYQELPFYGYRRITIQLRQRGFEVNHKKAQRLMQLIGLKAIYPKKRTTVRDSSHKVYPYLLRDLIIDKPNQVWQVDITYIKIKNGFVYLVCLIDVFSRKIMGWNISTFLDTESCILALEKALKCGHPQIINSDQGCQFTSEMWTQFLINFEIKISMDGKGRWVDNKYVERLWRTIKYENVYLHSYETVDQAKINIANYIAFYNTQRPHQKLNYHTPNDIFELGQIPSKQELFKKFKKELEGKSTHYQEAAVVS